MTLSTDKTVREYALEMPNATRVFEKLKIDYCCGGHRPIGDACAATGDYAAPPDACMSYRALYGALEGFEMDLHQHIHLENNLLFPRAVEMESAASRAL
jgi:iron-sulfur cluster repair protein YtfE (RIC family)